MNINEIEVPPVKTFVIRGQEIREFDLPFGELMKHLGIPNVKPLIEDWHVFVYVIETPTYNEPIDITASTIESLFASWQSLVGVLGRYPNRRIEVKTNAGQIRTTLPRMQADLMQQQVMSQKKTAPRRRSKLERIADAMGVEVIEGGGTFERVEWQRLPVLETHDPSTVGLAESSNQYPGVYALHVGDAEFWFYQLIHDYNHDEQAFELEIFPARGDILVEDVQYAMKDGIQDDHPNPAGDIGSSAILLTTRNALREGKDFRYTNQLTLRKQYFGRREFRYYVEKKPL